MKPEVYKAAVRGDMSIIIGGAAASESELQSLTSSNNNIIHIAAKHGQAEFIEESLKFSRANLINQQNINGDTPLHVAVRHGEKVAAKLLAADNPGNLLIAQNEDGDTPLHIALKYGYIDLACDLSERPESLSLINRYKETPLHLLIRCMPTVVKAVVEQPTSSLQMGMLNSNGVSSFPNSYFIDNTLESLLRHFLSSYQNAACLRDAEGLTPLLRAAHYGFFMAVEIILKLCPESVDVYDPKGRTVLHYVHFAAFMILQDLFKIPEIDALKNVKDCEGNTPAHLAVFNGDLLLIKVLHESMADFSLKNNQNISAEELIESHEGFFGKMEEAMFNSFTGIRIEKELYEAAAVKGDVTLFDRLETTTNISGREFRYDVAMLLSRTTNGSTILHLATQNSNSAFVKKTLKHFPTLLLSRNYSGDTVYHIAARLKDPAAEVMVSWFNDYYRLLKVMKSEPEDVICYTPPWITKNSKGNTAIHEAMRVSNYNIAVELLHMASSLSADTNNAGETALHVYARYATYTGNMFFN
ncbi:uncharacterized protein LOC104904240 [Beta vulgaris subsp. vulgaris]|uniref:uncharacterized protein LOC104904240 n=1 Tax=Beta vulgaris subsp. vulgaris TaxID=3555 RepID=UPI00053FB128|nr:uncharacterized protein LOC104904240 [Beta vulgaris subsp. vulgaris]